MKRCSATAAWWDAGFPRVRGDPGDRERPVGEDGAEAALRTVGFIKSDLLILVCWLEREMLFNYSMAPIKFKCSNYNSGCQEKYRLFVGYISKVYARLCFLNTSAALIPPKPSDVERDAR